MVWFCSEIKYIIYFLEIWEIWSYGLGYGGNVLLGKKCYLLCIVLVMVYDEGWLVEYMLIFKLILLENKVYYFVVVFLLVCGKINLVML